MKQTSVQGNDVRRQCRITTPPLTSFSEMFLQLRAYLPYSLHPRSRIESRRHAWRWQDGAPVDWSRILKLGHQVRLAWPLPTAYFDFVFCCISLMGFSLVLLSIHSSLHIFPSCILFRLEKARDCCSASTSACIE